MFGIYVSFDDIRIRQEQWDKLVAEHRECMSKEDFDKWYTEERRHRELCQAIRAAGSNARPKGGMFSGFY